MPLRLTLPDGTVKEFSGSVTGLDLASSIGPGLAKAALAIKLDGEDAEFQLENLLSRLIEPGARAISGCTGWTIKFADHLGNALARYAQFSPNLGQGETGMVLHVAPEPESELFRRQVAAGLRD